MSDGESLSGVPEIEIHDHWGRSADTVAYLEKHASSAVRHCLRATGNRCRPLLAGLEILEVSLVADTAIAEVHGEFMDDPTPTDVITFRHGEILISLETAARQAVEHGQPAAREALLYLIHGLLHLNGFDDREEEARKEMENVQGRILDTISPFRDGENPE